MMRYAWLVIAASLCSHAAWAQDLWAGVPLERLSSLALGEPTLHISQDAWQAPLSNGGWVRLVIFEGEEAGRQAMPFLARSLATAPLAQVAGHDAFGDGHLLVARDRNVVIAVRDPSGTAQQVVDRLRGALVTESPGGIREEVLDGRRIVRDACGRHVTTQ